MMRPLYGLMLRFGREEEGAAATEYALVVAFIASIVAAALSFFDLEGIFADVSDHIKNLLEAAAG